MGKYLSILTPLFFVLFTTIISTKPLKASSKLSPLETATIANTILKNNMDCRQQDSLVLVELYQATNANGWTNDWDLSQPMDTWFGVILNAEGCVEVLDLDGHIDANCPQCGGDNNLTDTIPASIWNLVHLKALSFGWNQVVLGNLPQDIDNLSELELLTMLQVEIQGEIPTSIGNLTNLKVLDLAGTNLSGAIPTSFQNLTNLTHLYLYNNQFTSLPDLSNLLQLKVLNVAGNPLGGTLPTWLGILDNLEELNWELCQLEGDIPANIWNGKDKLSRLFLSQNNLTGTLPTSLGNLTNLQFLFLADNQLTGTIPSELTSLSNLFRVDFSHNQLDGLIPDFTGAAGAGFHNLIVRGNKFTFEDLLPHFNANEPLFNNNSANNDYQPQALVGIPTSINFLAGEDYNFDLDIDDAITTNVYKWFKNGVLFQTNIGNNTLTLNNVTTADIGTYTCEITNPAIPDLTLESHPYRLAVIDPECRMKDSLVLVDLYTATDGANWTNTWDLNQPMTTWYGISLNIDGCVEVVDLDGNLDINCPGCFGNGNNLNGILPASFWNLKNLVHLSFSNSPNLVVTIPTEVDNLTDLKILKLEYIQLTGTIPNEIGDLTQLNILNLEGGQLTGSIPSSLNNLAFLDFLNLKNNQLTSVPDLSNLSNLTTLVLANNPFNTNFPDWIGELTELTELQLINNGWTGAIPPSMGNLTKLFFLNMENNKLTGVIPNSFSNLQELAVLSLYNNQLEGVFPSTVANLPLLEHLQINDNNFSGTIPDFTISNTRIRNLQLQNNKYTFKDILPNLVANEAAILNNNGGNTMYDSLRYNPQQKIGTPTNIDFTTGDAQLLSLNIDNFITSNVYTWYKDEVLFQTVNGNSNLSLSNLSESDAGVYTCKVTNANAPDLTLESHPFTLSFIDPSCRMRDSLILVDLYNATGGSSWTTTWDLNQSMTTWFGVMLNEFGCVSVLDLDGSANENNCLTCGHGGNNLVGSLPNTLWNLDNLVELSLNGNSLLNGTLPSAINNLIRLTLMNLGSISLGGTIPDELGDMVSLIYLNLGQNGLSGTIPSSLNNLIALKELILRSNNLSSLPDLSGLTELQDLGLSFNPFNSPLPGWIGSLKKLQYLSLIGNGWTGNIPSTFSNLTSLILLNLRENELIGNLPADFNKLNISALWLGNNQLTGDLSSSVLGEIMNLATIGLENNQLTGTIPDFSELAPNLRYLDLENNQLTFKNILPNLERNIIHIQNNDSNGIINYSPQAKVGTPTSENFEAGANYTFDLGIDDTVTTNVYAWFKNGQPFQTINGDNALTLNNVTTENLGTYTCEVTNSIVPDLTLESYPYTLSIFDPECRMKDSLVLVELYNATGGGNWSNTWDLNQPMTTWYGVELNVNGCVSVLDLDGFIGDCVACWNLSTMNGTIPNNIWSLKNLTELTFAGGNLNATIPDSIDELSQLTVLSFFNVNLLDGLPDEIGNLSQLTHLYFYENQLSGAVPNAISNLSNLQVLQLDRNQFTSIPDLSNLSQLQELSLTDNPFNSELPNWLGNLSALRSFYAHGCGWTGILPSNLGNLSQLFAIGLNHNQLTGIIPNNFSNLSLNSLALADNQLSGNIPDFLNDMTILNFVNLANNNFTGTIPDFTNAIRGILLNDNALTFKDILPNIASIEATIINNGNIMYDSLLYDPQQKVGMETTIPLIEGDDILFGLNIDPFITSNVYTWYKDGNFYRTVNSSSFLILNNAAVTDAGVYTCEVTNPNAPDLTLESYAYTLRLVDTECSMQDSLVLVDLYNATGGADWNTTWDLSQPMTTWYGVTVNEDGCVIGLDLDGDPNDNSCIRCGYGGNNLIGTIPNTLWNLDNLKELSLNGNGQLSGSISANVTNLIDLTILNIGNNNFNGTIPDEIGDLTKLVALNLTDNNFAATLPTSLNNLSLLRELYLADNQFTHLPDLGSLMSLNQLELANNPFNSPLPEWIGNLSQLNNLTAYGNGWTGNIPNSYGNLQNLSFLNLEGNQLTGTIPTSLSNLNPTFFLINNNQLSGDLAAVIGQMSNLISLGLRNNQFTGIIPDLATSAPNLQNIDVAQNQLTFEDILPNIATINAVLQANNNNQLAYSPQASVGVSTSFLFNLGDTYTFDLDIDENISDNVYRWYKNGSLVQTITGNNQLVLSNATTDDLGNYTCEVTNAGVPNLTLFSATYSLVQSIPSNDDICNAQFLTISTGMQGTFAGASSQINEPTVTDNDCQISWCNADLNGSVWYAFTAPANPYVNIRVLGTNFSDTKIALYEGINCGASNPFENATLVAASDEIPDQCCDGSLINLACLNAGSLYFIQVEQSNANQGDFEITVSQMASCELPCDLSFVNPPSVSPMTCPDVNDAVANHFVQSPVGHRLVFDLYDSNNNLLRTQHFSNFFGLSAGNYTFVARSLDSEDCTLSHSFEVMEGVDNIAPVANCLNSGENAAFVSEEGFYPFGDNSTTKEEMDGVFRFSWQDLDYETVNPQLLFSDAYNFVYLEGSGTRTNFDQFRNFLSTHQQLIEDWIALGNTIFINAAPFNWVGNDIIDLGFGGVKLNYGTNSFMATATDVNHPIFLGPHTPTSTSFTGSALGHSIICPPSMNATTVLKNENDNDLLVETSWGNGTIIFGGLTGSLFMNDHTNALNFRRNILDYLKNKAIPAANTPIQLAIDENQTSATLTSAMLNVGAVDNCELMSLQVSKTTFDCSELGLQSVFLMATDASGNVGNCATSVLVTDLNNNCPNDTDDCQNEWVINDTPMQQGTYAAATTITSTGTVSNNTTVVFKAGQSITLQTGFHAQVGSDFTAMIEDCTPATVQEEVATERTAPIEIPLIEQPNELALKAYPNPFNESATVDYFLPAASQTAIRLMDFMGKEVQIISPMQQTDAGWHQVQLNAANLPTGTYFLVLQNEGGMKTVQLILVN